MEESSKELLMVGNEKGYCCLCKQIFSMSIDKDLASKTKGIDAENGDTSVEMGAYYHRFCGWFTSHKKQT